MVDAKRVERKLSCLITSDPWYKSNEADRNLYRLSRFKKRCPERYNFHRNNILSDLEALKKDVDAVFDGAKRRERLR